MENSNNYLNDDEFKIFEENVLKKIKWNKKVVKNPPQFTLFERQFKPN